MHRMFKLFHSIQFHHQYVRTIILIAYLLFTDYSGIFSLQTWTRVVNFVSSLAIMFLFAEGVHRLLCSDTWEDHVYLLNFCENITRGLLKRKYLKYVLAPQEPIHFVVFRLPLIWITRLIVAMCFLPSGLSWIIQLVYLWTLFTSYSSYFFLHIGISTIGVAYCLLSEDKPSSTDLIPKPSILDMKIYGVSRTIQNSVQLVKTKADGDEEEYNPLKTWLLKMVKVVDDSNAARKTMYKQYNQVRETELLQMLQRS